MSLFTWPKKPVSDVVTLCDTNLRFDPELRKDSFKIKGVEYTRCAVIASKQSVKKKRTGKSPVWNHGEALLSSADDKRYYYCYRCECLGREQQLVSCNSGNGPALDHMSTHNLDRVTGEPVVGTSSPSIASSFSNGAVYQALTKTYALDEFKSLLVRWMVYCHVAFRMVENEYFRDLMLFLNSTMGGFLPRAASTVRGWIMAAYEKEKAAVRVELKRSISNVHLSFDGWTSPNNYTILSVFAHFIDAGGRRRIRLLAFRRTYGAHSAENEAAALLDVIQEYGIEKRVGYFMCDNLRTNDASVDIVLKALFPSLTLQQRTARRLRCLGHVANLCARALLLGRGAGKALTALRAKIEKGAMDAELAFWSKRGPVGMLHNIVRFIRASPQRIERFAGVVIGGVLSEFDKLHVSPILLRKWAYTAAAAASH